MHYICAFTSECEILGLTKAELSFTGQTERRALGELLIKRLSVEQGVCD